MSQQINAELSFFFFEKLPCTYPSVQTSFYRCVYPALAINPNAHHLWCIWLFLIRSFFIPQNKELSKSHSLPTISAYRGCNKLVQLPRLLTCTKTQAAASHVWMEWLGCFLAMCTAVKLDFIMRYKQCWHESLQSCSGVLPYTETECWAKIFTTQSLLPQLPFSSATTQMLNTYTVPGWKAPN